MLLEFTLCRRTRALWYSDQRLSNSMLFKLLFRLYVFHWTYGTLACHIWTYPIIYNRCLVGLLRSYGFASCPLFPDWAACAAALFGPALLLDGVSLSSGAMSVPVAGCNQ